MLIDALIKEETMTLMTYIIYLALCGVITIKVGTTLHQNGRIFLIQNFNGNEAVADAINNMLLVGFYLVNFGFVLLALQVGGSPNDPVEMIQFLSAKIGMAVLVLGGMHFMNMYVLANLRRFVSKKPSAAECAPVQAQEPVPVPWV